MIFVLAVVCCGIPLFRREFPYLAVEMFLTDRKKKIMQQLVSSPGTELEENLEKDDTKKTTQPLKVVGTLHSRNMNRRAATAGDAGGKY